MRKLNVYNHNILAGILLEEEFNKRYIFLYNEKYKGESISLTMPMSKNIFKYDSFPPFFEGLLPEGIMLENILRTAKIDKNDHMGLLTYCGADLVGSVTVEEKNV